MPAFLVLLRMWGARESRVDAWHSRGIASAAPVAAAVHSRVAYWLAFGAAAALAATVAVAMIATRGTSLFAAGEKQIFDQSSKQQDEHDSGQQTRSMRGSHR